VDNCWVIGIDIVNRRVVGNGRKGFETMGVTRIIFSYFWPDFSWRVSV